ncbi:MAG: SpoIIE family protein phosphatase [Candidatus Cloacimonetes bacterium]|nr:SpoIIE family protein phosphatase [Candidatus Cloacimonadota bacterium]
MISLKTKFLSISIALLICLGIIFAVYSIITTSDYQRLRLLSIRRTIKYEAARANNVIMLIERNVVQLATSGLVFYFSQSLEIGEISALELLRSFPAATGGGFWFEPYAFNENTLYMGIHAYRDDETGEVILDYIGDDYDYHSLNWYRDIIDKVESPYQIVWIKPYIDDTTNMLVITAGAGIFNIDGDLIGISIIDWRLDEVIEELTSIKPTENSIVLMFDPEHNHVIAHTYKVSETLPNITPIDTNKVRIPGTIESASRTWKEAYDVDISFVMIGDVANISLSRSMNNQWYLYVYSPIEEIFLETAIRNRTFTLTVFLISLLILSIAYSLITKFIYLPIKKLTFSVAQISLGNLDITTEVTSNDELGMLAKTFNKMTSDLKTSMDAYTNEHTEKERIKAELNIAAEIQSSMLPYNFPPFPDKHEFDIFATMNPAKEVGGDFYDFFFVDKNTLAIVIADVSGKGVPAALFMVIAKILIQNNAFANKRPAELFEAVNISLCENNDTGMFVTAFMGYYDISNGKFVYVNAGHNPPLIMSKQFYHTENKDDLDFSDIDFTYLKSKPSNILGWKKNAVFREEEIVLGAGDIIYLYTDGITEAMNPELELFSENRLLDVINKNKDLPLMDILANIKKEIENYAAGTEQADDITMLALKINHPEPVEISDDFKVIKEDVIEDTVHIENENLSNGFEDLNLSTSRNSIYLEADVQNLTKAFDFINDELLIYNCPQMVQNNILIAVEEVFANIVDHAYEIENSQIDTQYLTLSIFVEQSKVIITFEDLGKPFNPLEIPPPIFNVPLVERSIGGLGVYLVQQIMDNISYKRIDNKNILTLEKNMDNG